MNEVFDLLQIEYEENGDELRLPCPIHGGDNSSGFSWSYQYNQYRCWTNFCHEKGGRGSLDLIMKLKECTLQDACDLVLNKLGVTESHRITEKVVKHKDLSSVRPAEENFTYLLNRGYSKDLLKKHGTFYCNRGALQNRIVFPINDMSGKLLAFTGRTLIGGWKKLNIPKWKHLGNVGSSLFDVYRSQKEIKKARAVLLCEGPLDVLRLEMAGIDIALAYLGPTISGIQQQIIAKTGAIKVFIAGDNDKAGKNGAQRTRKILNGMFDTVMIDLPKNDWGDMSEKEIQDTCHKYNIPFVR